MAAGRQEVSQSGAQIPAGERHSTLLNVTWPFEAKQVITIVARGVKGRERGRSLLNEPNQKAQLWHRDAAAGRVGDLGAALAEVLSRCITVAVHQET